MYKKTVAKNPSLMCQR